MLHSPFLYIKNLLFPTAYAATSGLQNPIGSQNMTLADVILRITQFALGIVGLLSVVIFIYGGFIMLTSGGKSEQIQKAKDTLTWAALGIVTILLSYSFISLLWDVLTGKTS